jgi:hypothetical protein
VYLLPHEYFYYIVVPIDERKDPEVIDRKMTELYDTQVSKKIRQKRKANKDHRGHPIANVRYLRVQGERWFILIAQMGRHPFFKKERGNGDKSRINDVRQVPIKFGGYSIGYYHYPRMDGGKGKWKSSVRIARGEYESLQRRMRSVAFRGRRDLHYWIQWFRDLPYREWGGVLRQKYQLLKSLNQVRLQKGWPPVDRGAAISWQRKSVEVFIK